MVKRTKIERNPLDSRKKNTWGKGLLAGGVALGIQGIILLLAVLIGVLDPQPPKEAPLKLPKGSPSKHRAQKQAVQNQLAQINRLQSKSLRSIMDSITSPTAPTIPIQQPDLAQSIQAMGAMLPTESFFNGSTDAYTAGAEGDALPPPDPVEFLGENLTAKRIVLLLDVSGSVKTKMERAGLSMDQLRQEVHNFINQLGPNHLFGIIQFTRNWQAFRNELLPATGAVKQQASEWINTQFRTTGTSGRNWTRGSPNGIEGVLSAAFGMDVEVNEIFLVSDGDFQRTPPGGGGQDVPWGQLRQLTRTLQEESLGDTRLRMLCFHPPEAALPDLQAWVRENGPGSLRIHR